MARRRKPVRTVRRLRRLFRLWLILASAYALVIRPWHRRWGATDDEVSDTLPGDSLIPDANFASTRAVTIQAPPEAVWPWLAQMGQGRGGLYSYDWLENLMGLEIHSANRILPQFQALRVGDPLPLEPSGGGYTVAAIEPPHALVLSTAGDDHTEVGRYFARAGIASTWVFILRPLPAGRTRLIVRWRARFRFWRSTDPSAWLIGLALEPAEFIMERKMMLGIRARAEGPYSG